MIPARDVLEAMRLLPVQPVDDLLAHGPLLILAPHPDDESLGCGGLIAACCLRGVPPFVLVVTDGAGSHPNSLAYPPARLAAVRADEARAAVAALGLPADRLGFLNLPDTRSPLEGPGLAAAGEAISEVVQRHGIGTILASWEHDPHCDHLSAHRLAAHAAAAAGVRHLAYPVWGWTLGAEIMLPRCPTGLRIDVAAHLPAKRLAIAAHRSQYAGLIDDDPGGFQLPPDFLALFDGRYETVLDVDAAERSALHPMRPAFQTR